MIERLQAAVGTFVTVRTADASIRGYLRGPVPDSAINILLYESEAAAPDMGLIVTIDSIIEVEGGPRAKTED